MTPNERFANELAVVDWITELEDRDPDEEDIDAAFSVVYDRAPDESDGDSQQRFSLICAGVL